MAMAPYSRDALLFCKTSEEFQRVSLTSKRELPMSTYIDTVIQRPNRAHALYRYSLKPASLYLFPWQVSTPTPSSPALLFTSSVSISQITQAPMVDLLDLFVSSVIKNVLFILTDLGPKKENPLHERAVTNHRILFSLPWSGGKIEKLASVIQKYIIVESKKSLRHSHLQRRMAWLEWMQGF